MYSPRKKRAKAVAWLVTYLLALFYFDALLIGCSRSVPMPEGEGDVADGDAGDLFDDEGLTTGGTGSTTTTGTTGTGTTSTTGTTTGGSTQSVQDIFDNPLDPRQQYGTNNNLSTPQGQTQQCLTNDQVFGGGAGYCFAQQGGYTPNNLFQTGANFFDFFAQCAEALLAEAQNPRFQDMNQEYEYLVSAAVGCTAYMLLVERQYISLSPQLDQGFSTNLSSLGSFLQVLVDEQ